MERDDMKSSSPPPVGTPTKGWAETTSDGEQNDLVNNDFVNALRRKSAGFRKRLDSENLLVVPTAALCEVEIDWTKSCNRKRLSKLCALIRHIFYVFGSEEESSEEDASGGKNRFVRVMDSIINHWAYLLFFSLLTIYALFGPDIQEMHGETSAGNLAIASINTVVMALFLCENLLLCYLQKGFFGSGPFIVDMFATLSMVGDTVFLNRAVTGGDDEDAIVAGKTSGRLTRLMRVSGRSSRMLRLSRIVRILRVLKLVPRLQAMIAGGRRDFAYHLALKRLWHLFHCLDADGDGRLNPLEIEFFKAAMVQEFPKEKSRSLGESSPQLSSSSSAVSLKVQNGLRWSLSVFGGNSKTIDATFHPFIREFLKKPEGKRVLHRCSDDLDNVKDSFTMVKKATERITLKICVLVLLLLVAMPLLEADVSDRSDWQSLAHLQRTYDHSRISIPLEENVTVPSYPWIEHSGNTNKESTLSNALRVNAAIVRTLLANEPDSDLGVLCQLVNDYQSSKLRTEPHGQLMFIAVRNVTYLNTTSFCEPTFVTGNNVVQFALDSVRSEVQRLGLQQHELLTVCYPDSDCFHETIVATSVMIFNIREAAAHAGLNSLVFTSTVVIMMLLFVAFFASDLNHFSRQFLFHPLWELMDDMSAMKSIELVRTEPYKPEPYKPSLRAVLAQMLMGRDEIMHAEEITLLRKSYSHLRSAMRSWSKYVPSVLFMRLFHAGIEAKIGVTPCNVSVVFSDIDNFEDMCLVKQPQEVLDLLDRVLSIISDEVEENGGTLLEFIGDEVLAVFNAPNTVQNHEEKAVRCALGLNERMIEVDTEVVKLKTAVHSAEVLAGNLGSPTRMKYGLLGDGVNLAARLKALNTRYKTQLVVSAQALPEASRSMFLHRPIGHLVLKGKRDPTMVYEVLGEHNKAPLGLVEVVKKHHQAFDFYQRRRFLDAKSLFLESGKIIQKVRDDGKRDLPSQHMADLCEQLLRNPPPDNWTGIEHLTKKLFVPDEEKIVVEGSLSGDTGGAPASSTSNSAPVII